MRKLKVLIALVFIPFLLTGCSAEFISQLASAGTNKCQTLADNYWSEYQAYVDARAANNGIEDEAVMSHYYASSQYYLEFMQANCENDGYTLEGSDGSSTSGESNPSSDDYQYPAIVVDFKDRLNSVSSYEWIIDPSNDLTGSGSLGVVLSDQCGLWIFNSEDDIQNAYDMGLFQNSQTWFGTDSQTGYGVMLMTDSKDNQCAIDVMAAVNWSYLN